MRKVASVSETDAAPPAPAPIGATSFSPDSGAARAPNTKAVGDKQGG